jgi:hypothetical protein
MGCDVIPNEALDGMQEHHAKCLGDAGKSAPVVERMSRKTLQDGDFSAHEPTQLLGNTGGAALLGTPPIFVLIKFFEPFLPLHSGLAKLRGFVGFGAQDDIDRGFVVSTQHGHPHEMSIGILSEPLQPEVVDETRGPERLGGRFDGARGVFHVSEHHVEAIPAQVPQLELVVDPAKIPDP